MSLQLDEWNSLFRILKNFYFLWDICLQVKTLCINSLKYISVELPDSLLLYNTAIDAIF